MKECKSYFTKVHNKNYLTQHEGHHMQESTNHQYSSEGRQCKELSADCPEPGSESRVASAAGWQAYCQRPLWSAVQSPGCSLQHGVV